MGLTGIIKNPPPAATGRENKMCSKAKLTTSTCGSQKSLKIGIKIYKISVANITYKIYYVYKGVRKWGQY